MYNLDIRNRIANVLRKMTVEKLAFSSTCGREKQLHTIKDIGDKHIEETVTVNDQHLDAKHYN